MKITVLENINRLTIVDSITLYGSLNRAIPANREHVASVVASVDYPLPDVEVIILPFIIERIDDENLTHTGPVDGIAAYRERKIYLSAFHPADFISDYYRQLAHSKTLLHEIGHMVHYEYLPYPAFGTPIGLWQTMCDVGSITLANNSYNTSLAEVFAEWWRLLFSQASAAVPHRHGLQHHTGLKEWMRSLPGALTLAIGHRAVYWHGEVIPIDVAPQIVSGRTVVPLRFVAEVLGRNVSWSNPETVIIE